MNMNCLVPKQLSKEDKIFLEIWREKERKKHGLQEKWHLGIERKNWNELVLDWTTTQTHNQEV